jgi:hypothetical protein
MHIILDLRCNKAFINRRVVICLGLAFVAEKLVFPQRVSIDTNTFGGWTYSDT